jgi:hypothetical protein
MPIPVPGRIPVPVRVPAPRPRCAGPSGRVRITLGIASIVAAAMVLRATAADDPFAAAVANGRLVQEGLSRCHRYLQAWLAHAEPTTGLIPRNLIDSPYWNGKDSAADNYPFMVLSAWFTDRAAYDGPMRRMLETERRVTARPGWLRLTDDYRLEGTPGLRDAAPDAERIVFNSAEYVKDGLLALTEWLGPSPWSDRMFELLDDSFALAAVETPAGKLPMAGRNKETGVEVSGDYLQALARVYWLSRGQEKYLEWGRRIADYYLLPANRAHPTRDFSELRLRDHGCEIVSGLCEFYVTLHYAGKKPGGSKWAELEKTYRPHIHEMLDRILAVGRNADGLLFNSVDPKSGKVLDPAVSDSWGYVFDAYYAVWMVDGTAAYRDAAFRPLGSLWDKYRGFAWEPSGNAPGNQKGSHDGYADAIESALNLLNRLPASDPRATSAAAWLDSEIRELWSRQRADGLIEAWHGDGNFARTTIMYCLWKAQGISAQPWREDLKVGAARVGSGVAIAVSADRPWSGTLIFDRARHAEDLHLPVDWPRINQFPEWFTVAGDARYRVLTHGPEASPTAREVPGGELRRGLRVQAGAAAPLHLTVQPVSTTPR